MTNVSTAAFRHRSYVSCGSTNTLCFDAAADGEEGNLWITAGEQTGGKASRGRRWVSKPGNLYASLLLKNPSKIKHIPELTFVAALSVRKTIERLLPKHLVQLKWPNDVLLNEKKCSGVLLESRLIGKNSQVVIGNGINCEHYPKEVLFPATCMNEYGANISPSEIFVVLMESYCEFLNLWQSGSGFQSVLEEWLNYCWGLGQEATVKTHDGRQLTGIFSGVDAFGHMLLRDDSGITNTIHVGDVFPISGARVESTKSGELD